MPVLQNYNFRARNETGKVQTGVVQAISVEEAQKVLVSNHLVPLRVDSPKTLSDIIPFIGKVGLRDKTLFARQLATMIQAGLSLTQALRLLIRQTKKGQFLTILEAIQADISDGFSFSTALSRYPDVFDNVFLNVVRSGEATGKLETVLLQLAATMEKDVSVRGKIRGALFYPGFIITAMIGVAILMVTQVIPQLKEVFTSSGGALPPQTQFLLDLSDSLIHKWPLYIIGLVVFVVALRYFFSSEIGKEFMSRAVFKIPVANSITIESSMARFGRLIGMLLNSGVPMLEALRLVNSSFTNRIYQQAMQEIAAEVEKGIPMSVPIGKNPAFPLIVGQMVSVGEQTGKMDEVMSRMAAYYDESVDGKVAVLATLVEPFVIVLLGIGVAYLVIAILLPVYQISSAGGG